MPPILRGLCSIFQISLGSVPWNYILQGFFDQNSPQRRKAITDVFLGNTGDGIQEQKWKRETIDPASSFPPGPALRSPILQRPDYLAVTFQINYIFFPPKCHLDIYLYFIF